MYSIKQEREKVRETKRKNEREGRKEERKEGREGGREGVRGWEREENKLKSNCILRSDVGDHAAR